MQGLNPGEIVLRLGVYGATPEQQEAVFAAFMELLELRVGHRVRLLMPSEEVRNLPDPASMDDPSTEHAYAAAVSRNVPHLGEIVGDEADLLVRDIGVEYAAVVRQRGV